MPTARKLPSGSWRCLAYSHSEPVFDSEGQPVVDPKTKKQKIKRIYESFTSDDSSPTGKHEAENMASQFQLEKRSRPSKKRTKTSDMTLDEALSKYIESRILLGRSPATIEDYQTTQKYAFRDIIYTQLKDLDELILQESINKESRRKVSNRKNKVISAKRLKCEWGLVSSVIKKYHPGFFFSVELPTVPQRVPELLPAKTVLAIAKGTNIELPVLLAAWLSFSMSEVRGLTKSKSLNGNHIRIAEVVITTNKESIRKDMGKNPYRNRTHRIPPYIKQLIDNVEGDVLVPMGKSTLYRRWVKLLKDNNLPHMTFHDLRHLSASIMALLKIPDKYAQERGGWATDQVMKRVYTQTFPEERIKVDDIIDNYFENIINPESPDLDREKYNAWCVLFDKVDSESSKEEFRNFMQHEMQHIN